MRLYLKLSRNNQPIPFDYQVKLVGALHKWLGQNNTHHDGLSLYSLSWLLGTSKKQGNDLTFPNGAHLFISSPDDTFIKQILKGVIDEPSVCFGMSVKDALIQETPVFNNSQRFTAASPVFVKRTIGDRQTFFFHHQIESDALLTETLQSKLKKMGLPSQGVKVRFDREYLNPKIKVATYKGIQNKANICPVIVEGTPEQIGFAWDVGAGNSTGIGFGALTI